LSDGVQALPGAAEVSQWRESQSGSVCGAKFGAEIIGKSFVGACLPQLL
jgi:hypothetical protein